MGWLLGYIRWSVKHKERPGAMFRGQGPLFRRKDKGLYLGCRVWGLGCRECVSELQSYSETI